MGESTQHVLTHQGDIVTGTHSSDHGAVGVLDRLDHLIDRLIWDRQSGSHHVTILGDLFRHEISVSIQFSGTLRDGNRLWSSMDHLSIGDVLDLPGVSIDAHHLPIIEPQHLIGEAGEGERVR